jgi:hypothetical protein
LLRDRGGRAGHSHAQGAFDTLGIAGDLPEIGTDKLIRL